MFWNLILIETNKTETAISILMLSSLILNVQCHTKLLFLSAFQFSDFWMKVSLKISCNKVHLNIFSKLE